MFFCLYMKIMSNINVQLLLTKYFSCHESVLPCLSYEQDLKKWNSHFTEMYFTLILLSFSFYPWIIFYFLSRVSSFSTAGCSPLSSSFPSSCLSTRCCCCWPWLKSSDPHLRPCRKCAAGSTRTTARAASSPSQPSSSTLAWSLRTWWEAKQHSAWLYTHTLPATALPFYSKLYIVTIPPWNEIPKIQFSILKW